MMMSRTAEVELLLRSARPETERIDLTPFERRIRWDQLLDLADRQRATPILAGHLSHTYGHIPPAAAHHLQGVRTVFGFGMSCFRAALLDVIDEAEALGIPLVLLKGAALAVTVYPSFAERPMGDLDVLVPASRADELWNRLRSLGWAVAGDAVPRSPDEHHHLPELVAPGGLGVVLEIHRRLVRTGPVRLDAEWALANARFVELEGRRARVLGPEDQLLHLAVHFAWSNRLIRGTWSALRDVAALLDRQPIDIGRLVESAYAIGAERCLYWTLHITRRLGVSDAGAPILDALDYRPSGRLPGWLLERLLLANLFPQPSACPSRTVRRLLWSTALLSPEAFPAAARRLIRERVREVRSEPLRDQAIDLIRFAVWTLRVPFIVAER